MSTKTAINFMADKELKTQFYDVAKEMHTTPSNILNMLMKNVVITRSISISLPRDDFEVEPLDTSTWGEEFNKKTEELNKKAKNIFSNLKKEGVL